ncbi:MAG: hypothetical protein K2I08_04190 [Muribaculaceae bacterium]|nr:hypothetical protein [Muribaculaceae bacterium]
MNTTYATASLYLDIISSLYGSAAKARLLPPTKLFSQLKTSLKSLGPEGWRQGINDEIFDRALRLTKNADHLIADDHTAAQMVIWSLTHSLQPLSEIALLKKNDLSPNTEPQGNLSQSEAQIASKSQVGDLTIMPKPQASAWGNPDDSSVASERRFMEKSDEDNSSLIVNRSSLKKPRYLFPLRQSYRTPKQLQSHVNGIVNALFRRARLPQATNPQVIIDSLWAYAALRAGIPASELVAHLGTAPLGLPILRLSAVASPENATGLSQDETPAPLRFQRAISADGGEASGLDKENFAPLREIGKIFLDNPPQWYAMSLRPGVRFTQVCHRIDQLYSSNAQRTTHDAPPELFYPSEEIARAIGKKIVTRQRPFIHNVVFFRAKLTDIARLFSKIGDLAWCYRQSARPGAPYAHITEAQFRLFQQTIAQFTPDYEVAPTGELELTEGDRVEILGGLFAGHEATLEGKLSSFPASDLVTEGTPCPSPHVNNNTIYRLNIIGDNGIEWRINVNSRLLQPSAKRQE